MFDRTLRAALMASGAAIGVAVGPALAGEMEDPKAQLESLQSRLDHLESQKPVAASVAKAAPANAVVGGDFPGSFKLPESDPPAAPTTTPASACRPRSNTFSDKAG